jgi:hypothetical protein
VPDIGPTGFTFNQFLIDADDPAKAILIRAGRLRSTTAPGT